LWHLGYPDRAIQCGYQALALARELSHPVSLTLALNSVVALHHWRGEWHAAWELGAELLSLAQQQAFPHWAGWGMLLRGEILARQGCVEEGIVQMRQGFAALNSTGAKMGLTGLSCELAWAYEKAGRAEEGLPLVTEALAAVDKTGERFAVAELYRFKGELLLHGERMATGKARPMRNAELVQRSSFSVHRSAEECFQQAIAIARRQGAKSLELTGSDELEPAVAKTGEKETSPPETG